MNRRADRGRMGKSQKSAKPYGRATPNWIPQSGIHFSPSLSQAKDHPSINVRKILDTTVLKERDQTTVLEISEGESSIHVLRVFMEKKKAVTKPLGVW